MSLCSLTSALHTLHSLCVTVREYRYEKEAGISGPVLYGIIAAVVILVAVFGLLLVFVLR